MGEIEDLVRRRKDDEAARQAAAEQEAVITRERRREEFISRVEELVPKALRALEEAGWPGAELVTVRGMNRWRPRKTEEVACWDVGWKQVTYKDNSERRPMRLLRDGRWLGAGEPVSFESLCKEGLPNEVEEDLRKLISLSSD